MLVDTVVISVVIKWGDHSVDDSFSLVDHLPPNLESLRIYGYKKEMKPRLRGVPQNCLKTSLLS